MTNLLFVKPFRLGVSKSVIAEVSRDGVLESLEMKADPVYWRFQITDDTNIGDAFAWMPMTWGFGTTIGHVDFLFRILLVSDLSRSRPFLGGVLSEPAKRWPETFGKFAFFHLHPYFLPCAAAAAITFLAGVITFLGLREVGRVFSASKMP